MVPDGRSVLDDGDAATDDRFSLRQSGGADIARLAAFPQTPESLLQNYLYGTAAEKAAATTYFFRYPGSGDGNGLRTNYNTITGRHMMWDLHRFDIALGLGYATQAQKDLMLGLAESFVNAKFPTCLTPDGAGGGNLRLEEYTPWAWPD